MSNVDNNMDCADIKAMLSALIDDQVDTETRHLAERHLVTCAACRTLLNEAEALDDLMARDSQRLGGGAALPAGFEAAVIEQALLERPTVRRSLVTWAGWFAAAACLMLAVLIWSFDRQMLINNHSSAVAKNNPALNDDSGDARHDTPQNTVRHANYQRRSWTFDGDLPEGALTAQTQLVNETSNVDITMNKIQQPLLDPAFDTGNAAMLTNQSNLTREDVQTLYAVSLVMETLEDADLRSFAEVDRIRQITEYDDLLPRLEQTLNNLSAEDRVVVGMAESVLRRIVRGPITEQVARELGSDASELELADSLQKISTRNSIRSSM